MVKAGRRPCRGGVANLALLRKPCSLVVGIGRVVVVGKVTGHARRAQPRIVPVHMACLTTDLEMRSGQRKRGARVVERRSRPTRGAVADGAILRETRCRVVGIRGFLIIRQVTGSAVARRAGVTAVGVALRARHGRMSPRQGKAGKSVVIESRSAPTAGAVADGTIRREASLHVIGILGGVVFLGVAADTVRASPLEVSITVAGRAVQLCVHPGEREARELRMIKRRAQPTVHGVALFARDRE